MSFLSDAIDSHLDALGAVAGEPITYVRHENSVLITAVPGRRRFETLDKSGVIIEIIAYTFRFKQNALRFAGVPVVPERNDLIRYTVNGEVGEYRLLPDFNLPHYRETDSNGKGFVVYTKRVA